MAGLEGRYEMLLDAKNRLVFPAKQRERINGNVLHITQGLDGCLFAFSEEQWERFKEKMKNLPLAKAKLMERYFIGNSLSCEMDAQGRVKLDKLHIEFASLEREITLIGLCERIEIWATDRWNEANRAVSSETINAILEEIDF